MVGATGFEPATTCTPSKCATRLRYAPEREREVSPDPGGVNANVSVPEAEREDRVSVAASAVSGEGGTQPVVRAPQGERPEAHVETERQVQASRDVVEAVRFPVRAAAHAEPAWDPLVLRSHA